MKACLLEGVLKQGAEAAAVVSSFLPCGADTVVVEVTLVNQDWSPDTKTLFFALKGQSRYAAACRGLLATTVATLR